MNEYIIIKTNVKEYDRLILCLTFESLLTYIHKIENNLEGNLGIKHVLIDQLLITGNNSNRFIKCNFLRGKLDLNTAQIVKPSDYLKKETVKWLHNNYHYVKNSILTDEQRQKIKDNIVF
ncbi:TPA: type II toxin-antitoxin system RnlB family antitoxin [Streptococcus agalactiae]